MKWMSSALLALFTAATFPAQAGIIYGTGQDQAPGQRDAHWDVVSSFSAFSPPGGQSYPYDAYVYNAVPTNWYGTGGYGVDQTGYTNTDGTFYWVGPQATSDSALPFPQVYGYILAQSFYVDTAGYYDFSFGASGDNYFSFFINGTVSTTDAMKPTITGGTQIGATLGGFDSIQTLSGQSYLHAGTNWAYAVVEEHGFSTGMLVAQSTFTASVPEPSMLALQFAGLPLVSAAVWRSRRRRTAPGRFESGGVACGA